MSIEEVNPETEESAARQRVLIGFTSVVQTTLSAKGALMFNSCFES